MTIKIEKIIDSYICIFKTKEGETLQIEYEVYRTDRPDPNDPTKTMLIYIKKPTPVINIETQQPWTTDHFFEKLEKKREKQPLNTT